MKYAPVVPVLRKADIACLNVSHDEGFYEWLVLNFLCCIQLVFTNLPTEGIDKQTCCFPVSVPKRVNGAVCFWSLGFLQDRKQTSFFLSHLQLTSGLLGALHCCIHHTKMTVLLMMTVKIFKLSGWVSNEKLSYRGEVSNLMSWCRS